MVSTGGPAVHRVAPLSSESVRETERYCLDSLSFCFQNQKGTSMQSVTVGNPGPGAGAGAGGVLLVIV